MRKEENSFEKGILHISESFKADDSNMTKWVINANKTQERLSGVAGFPFIENSNIKAHQDFNHTGSII